MKKLLRNRLAFMAFIAMIVSSCESDQETFKEFLDQGENVIVGAVEDVMVSHGVKKLKLDVAINGDPKVKKIIIFDGTNEIGTFDVVRQKSGKDTLNFILDELDEKLYNFIIRAVDDSQNNSLPFEFVTNVHGDKYIKNLSTRKVTGVVLNGNDEVAEIKWDASFERMKDTKLTYTNRDGEAKTLVVSNDETETTIADYDGGSSFTVVSAYWPPLQDGEVAFEEFVSLEVNEIAFPACETLASIDLSATSFDFGQLNKDQNSPPQNFTVQSGDCISGDVTLSTSAPFRLALAMGGPFESTVSLESIEVAQTVYVRFSPASGRNQVYSDQITLSATNLGTTPPIDLKGEETGNDKSGLNILGPDEAINFATVTLPNDGAPRLDWGGPYHEALFDGNMDTHGHGDIGSNPGHFTVDLGKGYVITKVGWKHRSGFQSRGLKRYQVWGLPGNMEVNTAATSTVLSGANPATESAWAKEMAMNGWVSLVNASLSTNPPIDEGKTHEVSGFVYVRYIRVAVFESFDGNFYNFGELELTADFDQ